MTFIEGRAFYMKSSNRRAVGLVDGLERALGCVLPGVIGLVCLLEAGGSPSTTVRGVSLIVLGFDLAWVYQRWKNG